MLIGIEGELGGGKTLLLVKYLKAESKHNRRVLTNLTLNEIPYEQVNVMDLLENNSEFNNVVLGIDELTVYVDCRLSMSKANRFFSYLILQSRKRDVDIYYTTQDMNMIEGRVVNHTNITALCEKMYNKQNQLIQDYRMYTLFDFRNRHKPTIKSFIMDIRPYYKYYDTNQIITPLYDTKTKLEKKI